MTDHEIRQAYCSMDDAEKLGVNLRLAAKLTVFARETYVPGSEEIAEPSRLRLINELQHRLLFFTLAIQDADAKRYPDNVMLTMLLSDYPNDWPELGAFVRRELKSSFSLVKQ